MEQGSELILSLRIKSDPVSMKLNKRRIYGSQVNIIM
jgi:hypothetical protein